MSKKMMLAAAAVAGVALAGCSTQEPTWQEALTASLADEMTAQQVDDFCAGAALFGLDTPEEVGALVIGLADGELPSGSTTVAEWLDEEGIPQDDLGFRIDADAVTVRELAVEAGRIMLAECGL